MRGDMLKHLLRRLGITVVIGGAFGRLLAKKACAELGRGDELFASGLNSDDREVTVV